MALSPYFSADYQEARRRFIDAAGVNGFTLRSFMHPLRDRDGGLTFIDIARKVPESTRDVILTTSATHGVEGYAGSAAQIFSMKHHKNTESGLVHVHALNPYGFAHNRRVNEDNIDLNRNFIDWTNPPPADHSLNPAIQAALKSAPLLRPLQIAWLIAQHGMPEAKAALTQGQYGDDKGLFYGGAGPAWSNLMWHRIIAEESANIARLVHIDFHTGLGPRGYGELMVDDEADGSMFRRARSMWGKITTPLNGSASSSKIRGSMSDAFEAAANPGTLVTSAVLEFGTLPLSKMLQAMADENRAFWTGRRRGRSIKPEFRDALIAAFNPDDAAWQNSVLERSSRVITQALGGFRP